jgi:hypothetical protein
MPGGGANWVNYMTWCYYYNKILPTVPLHFSNKIIRETFPEYNYLFWLQSHQIDSTSADIVFGSRRNGLNLKINNIIKNGNSTYKPEDLANFDSPQLDYDLDWALIVENPEQFVKDVNQLSGYNIKFNSIVEQAFVQYLNSAYPDPLLHGDQYQNHPWIVEAFEYLLKNLSTPNLIDEAWHMIDSQWIKYYPATWHS